MKRHFSMTTVVAMALSLFCITAQAKKPDNQGGGGGGGGTSYQVVKLDDLDGVLSGTAYDINDSRLIVGGVVDASGEETIAMAAYWTVSGSGRTTHSNLSLLFGGQVAFGCNQWGEIVGSGNDQAVYWAGTNAPAQVLPMILGDVRSGAEAISNAGVICGWSQSAPNNDGERHTTAVAWRVTKGTEGPEISGPFELATIDPGVTDYSVASDITGQDSDGVISIVGESNFHATVWRVSLGEAGGLVAESTDVLTGSGNANGANNVGVVCGRANLDTSTANTEAVTWTHGVGRVLDLDRSAIVATPFDVNDNGVIVGMEGIGHAVVWASPEADMVRLDKFVKNSPFDSLTTAQAVNEFGEIVGSGRTGDEYLHPFVAIPK